MALNPRKQTANPVWDGNWDALPGTLTARHMAAIFGVTLDTIWRQVGDRRIAVAPMRWVKPYRWLRDRVRKELGA
jgi:hypothetical protein